MNYRILSINTDMQTMVIDWLDGQVLNHNIPLYILENPGMPKEEIEQHISYMRPPAIVKHEICNALLDMAEAVDEGGDVSSVVFSVLEFRDRFTLDEQIAIRTASIADVEVGLVYDNFLAASCIDLNDERVEQGLSVFVLKGLITEERKQQILANETPAEES